jgi:hypothetical protein
MLEKPKSSGTIVPIDLAYTKRGVLVSPHPTKHCKKRKKKN